MVFILFVVLVSACQPRPQNNTATISTITTIALPQPTAFASPTFLSPTIPVTGRSASSTPLPTLPPLVTATIPLAAVSPTPAGLRFSHPQMVTLVDNLPNPDDLALGPDGSIYISDVGDGSVRRFAPDGRISTLVTGLAAPEGMVILPDGVLVIAEQGKNRLMRFDPKTQAISTFLVLKNTTGQDGVDGIALDTHNPQSPSLIIPDSPNGTLLRASLDGRTVQAIARGFVRPTAAWVEADGSILVADEYDHALVRVRENGVQEVLSRSLATPDDVIEHAAGQIFVNTLGDGGVHVLSLDGKQDVVVIRGLSSPQGEIFDAAGNLIVTDPGRHRVVRIVNQ